MSPSEQNVEVLAYQEYLDNASAAAWLGVSPENLRKSRSTKELLGLPAPGFIRLGQKNKSRVRYRVKDLRNWMQEHTTAYKASTSGPAQPVASIENENGVIEMNSSIDPKPLKNNPLVDQSECFWGPELGAETSGRKALGKTVFTVSKVLGGKSSDGVRRYSGAIVIPDLMMRESGFVVGDRVTVKFGYVRGRGRSVMVKKANDGGYKIGPAGSSNGKVVGTPSRGRVQVSWHDSCHEDFTSENGAYASEPGTLLVWEGLPSPDQKNQ